MTTPNIKLADQLEVAIAYGDANEAAQVLLQAEDPAHVKVLAEMHAETPRTGFWHDVVTLIRLEGASDEGQ